MKRFYKPVGVPNLPTNVPNLAVEVPNLSDLVPNLPVQVPNLQKDDDNSRPPKQFPSYAWIVTP